MYDRIIREMAIHGIRYVAELERKAEVKPGTIRSVRYGHIPSSNNLVKLAKALEVSVNYLLTGVPDDDSLANPTPPEVYEKQRRAIALLEGLSDENYQAAIDYLTFLKAKEERK